MTVPERPVPVPDERSAAFWEAAGRHVLTLARCSVCGAFSHPPDLACDHCGSTTPEFTFTPVEGHGLVRSWTVMRRSFLPGFADVLPFVLVDVELTEHPDIRLIGRLLDGEDPRLRVGAGVDVTFEDLRDGVSVPAFVLGATS